MQTSGAVLLVIKRCSLAWVPEPLCSRCIVNFVSSETARLLAVVGTAPCTWRAPASAPPRTSQELPPMSSASSRMLVESGEPR